MISPGIERSLCTAQLASRRSQKLVGGPSFLLDPLAIAPKFAFLQVARRVAAACIFAVRTGALAEA